MTLRDLENAVDEEYWDFELKGGSEIARQSDFTMSLSNATITVPSPSLSVAGYAVRTVCPVFLTRQHYNAIQILGGRAW